MGRLEMGECYEKRSDPSSFLELNRNIYKLFTVQSNTLQFRLIRDNFNKLASITSLYEFGVLEQKYIINSV